MKTLGQLATFAIELEAAVSVCEAKRAALVQIVDHANKAVKPKRRFGIF